jgi:hypothetical protein
VTLPKRLARGTYKLLVRATDTAGQQRQRTQTTTVR